jgi:hypothetical protein
MTTLGNPPGGRETTRLTLEVWHPNCWTLDATAHTDAGLVAHTVYNTQDERVRGHFSAYGDSMRVVDNLVRRTRESHLTDSVVVLNKRHDFSRQTSHLGNTSKELFVEYDPENSMSDALLDNGFVHDAPVRIRDGREYWPVFVAEDRDTVKERIERLREEKDASIDVTKITSDPDYGGSLSRNMDRLSERQREIFELACEHDYYSWPRQTTTRELAAELDITKTTLLEHLRKAEAKLLNQA